MAYLIWFLIAVAGIFFFVITKPEERQKMLFLFAAGLIAIGAIGAIISLITTGTLPATGWAEF
jgi:lipoprotein signal peptidase